MDTPWTPDQLAALGLEGPALLMGAAGAGKTALLVEKAARLARAGTPPESIGLTTFAVRTIQGLKTRLALALGAPASRVQALTLHDFAMRQLAAAGQTETAGAPAFASNNQVRQILRDLIRAGAFEGTLEEAEHIVRLLKSRAKKVAENERFYGFYLSYKARLAELHLADRNDIIRAHILAIRNGSALPAPVKWLLLDNLQDATELQLAWLKEHLAAGVTLWLAGNDDLTAFGPDGAMGRAALEQVATWGNMTPFTLAETFRMPQGVAVPVGRIARQLKSRMDKPDKPSNPMPGRVAVQRFESASAEHAFLAAKARELAAPGAKGAVGIVTRDDHTANWVAHTLRRNGFNPACYARLIWEEPPAQRVLGLLYLILGRAGEGQLRLVLEGFGLSAETVNQLYARGLVAEDWLARGCPLPSLPEASPTVLSQLGKLHRQLTGAYTLMAARTLTPQDVFKGLVYTLMEGGPEAEHPTILLAVDMLLGLSGKLADALPRVITETMPDMTAPVAVAPVREVRNLEFRTLIIPHAHADQWPAPASKLLGPDLEHERRLFYLALSRTQGDILVTHHQALSPLAAELQGYLK